VCPPKNGDEVSTFLQERGARTQSRIIALIRERLTPTTALSSERGYSIFAAGQWWRVKTRIPCAPNVPSLCATYLRPRRPTGDNIRLTTEGSGLPAQWPGFQAPMHRICHGPRDNDIGLPFSRPHIQNENEANAAPIHNT
jgi:hypothetical protein